MNDQTKEGLKRGAFQCLWPVPNEGFEWSSDLEQRPGTNQGPTFKPDPFKRPPWLVCQSIRPNYITFRDESCTTWYSPLSHPNLHRRFAKLEPTQYSIIRFANRYGFLAYELGVYKFGSALSREGLGVDVYGEPISTWRGEIIRMKRLIEFWGYIRSGNHGKLASIVRGWDKVPPSISIKHTFPEYKESIWATVPKLGRDEKLIALWKSEERMYSGPVLRYIIDEINEAVETNSTIKLDTTPSGSIEITVSPSNLLCAMYVLFAFEVSEHEEPLAPKICPVCGVTFKAPTRRKRFCSDKCRVRNYYYTNPKSKRYK